MATEAFDDYDYARVLERTEDPSYGSIQGGKVADLVLLDGDPIADSTNLDKINRIRIDLKSGAVEQMTPQQAT